VRYAERGSSAALFGLSQTKTTDLAAHQTSTIKNGIAITGN
jgi:hypothetical protein